MWTRSLVLLLVGLAAGGCQWSYSPVRMPSRQLWVAASAERPPIASAGASLEDYTNIARLEGVSVAVDMPDAAQTTEMFGVDLLAHRIQPLVILIDNRSRRAYDFSKTGVSVPYVPVGVAARRAHQHPARTAARLAKWAVFLVPGALFSAVIEPTTTLEFPGMADASARPPKSPNREITADFQAREISDGTVTPGSVLSGMLFTHPLIPDTAVTISLRDVETQEALAFVLPMPPAPFDRHRHLYPASKEKAWEAVLASASTVRIWTVAAQDADQGRLTVKKSVPPFWRATQRLAVFVQPAGPSRTSVEVVRLDPRTGEIPAGAQRGIERFFEELAVRLEPPAPPKTSKTSPIGSGSVPPSAVPLDTSAAGT